ncbi:MAG TPA: hypothetical protein VMW14_01455, partial [Candidatus Paceibacterota bacterium]|nr:hypothetical protein [Candidatus Paceibacterota bacterium]
SNHALPALIAEAIGADASTSLQKKAPVLSLLASALQLHEISGAVDGPQDYKGIVDVFCCRQHARWECKGLR